MKETTWSKLRELWAIRRRCKQIKLEQRAQYGWNLTDQTTGGFATQPLPPLAKVPVENI